MGVHQLWSILEPVKQEHNVSSLIGKTVCVDLSGWICEAQCAKGLKASVNKPHLRNIFFRVLNLTRLGVRLVFVVDGKAPELKWEAMAKRVQSRYGTLTGVLQSQRQRTKGHKKMGRSNFTVWVNECRTLLKLLGVPCVDSPGEAEAMCAWLDYNQIVDGCITNDGDAFLYGARTVYKEFAVSAKESFLECYKMDDIERQLGLNRRNLVALALLLGCDYLPQGVAGVGREMAVKLTASLKDTDLLGRFRDWKTDPSLSNTLSSIEKTVKRKAIDDKKFPNQEVIDEFLSKKSYPKSVRTRAVCANLASLQEFCLKYLDWPLDYTREKVLPLITYWQMDNTDPLLASAPSTVVVQPERILKERVQMKVECYEVLWHNIRLGNSCMSSFVTIETRALFKERFPAIVEEFENLRQMKRIKSGKRNKIKVSASSGSLPEDEMEVLAVQMAKMDVVDKVTMTSSHCLEFRVTNTKEISESISDDKSDSFDFSDELVKQQDIVSSSTQEYIEEQLNNQVSSCSSEEGDESTDEDDLDSFSFPSLSERLSKKGQLHSIYATSSGIKQNGVGARNFVGNVTGDNYDHSFGDTAYGRTTTNMVRALCAEKRVVNNERRNTEANVSPADQYLVSVARYKSKQSETKLQEQRKVAGNIGETEAAALDAHFQSPNKQTQILSNNIDLSNVDNLDRVLPVDNLCNGELCTNAQGVKLTSSKRMVLSPCISNEELHLSQPIELGQASKILEEHCDLMSKSSFEFPVPLSVVRVSEENKKSFSPEEEAVENEICEYAQEGLISTPDQMNTTTSFKAKLPEEHLGGLTENARKFLKTNKSSEHLCVSSSPLRHAKRAETSSSTTTFIDSSSPLFDDVFIESSLNDDNVFVVPSLRERLRQRLAERNISGLHSTPLLVEFNKENREFCNHDSDKYNSQLLTVQKCNSNSKDSKDKTEGEEDKKTSCSPISKDRKAVKKEVQTLGGEKELKKNYSSLFQKDIAIVDKAQIDRINLVQEEKRVRKKTIPKSQRRSCIDSPQEVVAVGRKRGKGTAKCKK